MLALVTAVVLATALHAEAQTAASFDELSRTLGMGDRITVTDARGEDLVGRILELTPSTLYVDALRRESRVIYGAPRAAGKRWTVSPLLAGHRRGVVASLGF